MAEINFSKGHGTANDFIIILDRHDMYDLTVEQVQFLCDRHRGIGADGVLRVVKASHMDPAIIEPLAGNANDLWFMDYRNSDGSIAEMCGNGLRVFVKYVLTEGLDSGEKISVLTRAGYRQGALIGDQVQVTMGQVSIIDQWPIHIRLGDKSWEAIGVDAGNPYAVVFVGSQEELLELDLSQGLTWEPLNAFPDGVNVEFVYQQTSGELDMRVLERGSGETLSCGTGIVASAKAAQTAYPVTDQNINEWIVNVPGGRTTVDLTDPDDVLLTGAAQLVFTGTVKIPD